jgi:hypothetical protein
VRTIPSSSVSSRSLIRRRFAAEAVEWVIVWLISVVTRDFPIFATPERLRRKVRSAGQLLEERQDIAVLQLTVDDHMAISINAVDLENRLSDVATDCRALLLQFA